MKMEIRFNSEKKLFRIILPEMEYGFCVNEFGELVNLHWGAPLKSDEDYVLMYDDGSPFTYKPHGYNAGEYRFGSCFDYAAPAIRVRFPNGAESLRLIYKSHSITDDSLEVMLEDEIYKLEIKLVYKTYGDLPLISRYAVITNNCDGNVELKTAMSAVLQLPIEQNFRLTHFAGEWGAEYQRQTSVLNQSRVVLETSYLTDAASHIVPFFALDNTYASETLGDVYFGALQYSGDFKIIVETQRTQTQNRTSVTMGINDFTSEIELKSGENFITPNAVVGFSNRGFEHMSEILYDWQYDYELPRGKDTDKAHSIRPVIYNTWCPFTFSITEDKVIDLIPKVKHIGAELYIIDDAWMKGRTNDQRGLGDWVIDEERFPHGLRYISDKVHEAGLKFGLWVEPEMVNPDSDLYRAHPDWVLSEPNREKSLFQRNQFILDMSRDDITDWTIDWLDKLIIDADLDYLKWDLNREVTESGLDHIERGVAVKYMRNIERIWEHLNDKFPDMLFTNCASGGGRADYGMIRYTDLVNISDNSDPADNMLLHEGYFTLFVPKLAGGAGNLSISPHRLNGRTIPLDFRANMGMTGSMSVGVNLLKADEEELDAIRDAVIRFKELRPALHDSYVYKIASARENTYSILQYVKRDKSQFTMFAFGHGMHQWDKYMPRFKMRGLDPNAVYVNDSGKKMSGAALMNSGISIARYGYYQSPMHGDWASLVETWRAEEK